MMVSNLASHSKKSVECKRLFFCCRPIVPLPFEQCFLIFIKYMCICTCFLAAVSKEKRSIFYLDYQQIIGLYQENVAKTKNGLFGVDAFCFQMVSNKVF